MRSALEALNATIIWELCGVSTTRANTSTSTGGGLGAQKRSRAGVGGGAGGQDIVDQHHPAAGNLGCCVRSDLERALHIAGALLAGQADLLLGRPHPPQRLGRQFDAGLPLDHPRQRAGLVVAAAPAPPPVQRHRHQRIGLGQQFAPGPRHPAAHRGRQIGAVLVFQRMHQRACDIVIAHRGAGALHRPADWRSPPSTAIRGRDRRQRECRAAGKTAAR